MSWLHDMVTSAFVPAVSQVAASSAVPADWSEFENLWVVGYVYLGMAVLGLLVNLFLLMRGLARPSDWKGCVTRLTSISRRVAEAVRLMLVMTGLYLGASLAFTLMQHAGGVGTEEPSPPGLVVQSVIFHWTGLLCLSVLLRQQGMNWGQAFGMDTLKIRKAIRLGVVFYLGSIPFVLFFSWMYQLILQGFGYESTMQEVAWVITSDMTWDMRLYMLVLAMVVAPLLEELIFRGILLPLCIRRFGVTIAVCLTSLVFAFLHYHLSSVVPLFIISMAFSLAYIYTGSIIVPFVMHAVFNGINVGMLLILRAM